VAHHIAANGLTHFIRDDGAKDAPAALLLHGFPDSSAVWSKVTPLLVEAGCRVVAPDLRGFGETDMAHDVSGYDLALTAQDVLAVMDALKIAKAHLVGHDFGAALAWRLAAQHPDRFLTLTAISVGHPRAFLKAGAEQKRRSFYILVHQLRGICEWLYRRNDWRLLRTHWDALSDADETIRLLSRPGRLTAGLNWYRANINLKRVLVPPKPGTLGEDIVRIPTMGVFPSGDKYLTEAQMALSSAYVDGPWSYERIEGASHWVQQDAPERLAALLIGHFGATGDR
jgi:pimeloyl-ACP methyl ester carboxylesterase